MGVRKKGVWEQRYQSAATHVVLAVSVCIFFWILATVNAPDVGFDDESTELLAGPWEITYEGQSVMSELPGPFYPEKGETVTYSKSLDMREEADNSIMLHAIHQYVRIYVDGFLILESGYGQTTPFGSAPYKSWVIARLPRDWSGKTLTIEMESYYDAHSVRLDAVYSGTKNSLVFLVLRRCAAPLLFNVLIILIGTLLLLFSLWPRKWSMMRQTYYLSLFSLVTSFWLLLESGGYQLFWGNAPAVSSLMYILYSLIAPLCIRFILTSESFEGDRLMNGLFWLSIVNFVAVQLLQILGIRDYIDSMMGSHMILVLLSILIFTRYFLKKMRREEVRDSSLFLACMTFAIFAALDIVRFYIDDSGDNASYFSQIGLFLFFIILVYHVLQEMLREREAGMKEELLEQMAYVDLLTGLPNRNAYEKEMGVRRKEARDGCIVAVADLNELKMINDTCGHQQGDAALTAVSGALKSVFGDNTKLYRIGGDEFCVIAVNADEQEMEEAFRTANKLLRLLSTACISYSIAAGWYRDDGCGIDEAFRRADHNMYLKKLAMKGRKDETDQ